MRGATQDECTRVAVKGEILRVGRLLVPTGIADGEVPIFALTTDVDFNSRVLVYAVPGTQLLVISTRKAVWPGEVEKIFGQGQAVGAQLMA